MGSLRIGWIAAWGGTAFGAFLVGSPVLGDTFPFWVAGVSLAIGVVGYWLMRWRRDGFDTRDGEPAVGPGGKYRLSVIYELGQVEGGFVCKIKHPQQLTVGGVMLYRGERTRGEALQAWVPGKRSALRRRTRSAKFSLYSPKPRKGDTLSFILEAEEEFDADEVKFYRRD